MPRRVRALEVRYDFHPHDTGLGYSTNVVDIGIFDPSGQGARERRGLPRLVRRRAAALPDHPTTGRRPATSPGRSRPGRWHVILGPFLITPTGDAVDGDGDHGARRPRASRRSSRTTRRPRFRARAPAGTAATCTCTRSSPTAAGGPGELVEQAQRRGLDFIGTSEHNTNAATRVFGRVVPDGFLVVSGEEVTTRNGHWLATGTTPGTWVDWRYRAEDDKLGRFTDLTRDRGGVAIAAHPYVPVAGTRWDFGTSYDHMDAVEVWNGPWSFFNQLTLNNWQRLLAGGHFVPAVGNSDSHHSGQVVGLSQTVYRMASLSTAADRGRGAGRALLDRRVVGGRPATSPAPTPARPPRPARPGDSRDRRRRGAARGRPCRRAGVPGTLAQLIGTSGTVLASAFAENDGTVLLQADVDRVRAVRPCRGTSRAPHRGPHDVPVDAADGRPHQPGLHRLTRPIVPSWTGPGCDARSPSRARRSRPRWTRYAGEPSRCARAVAGRRRILFVARGSSDNAAVYGRYLAETQLGVPAALAAPSVATHYHARVDLSDTLVVSISQSGRTEEIVEVQRWARSSGAATVAISNDADSPLAAEADVPLTTQAGAERAVPATKSYSSQLAALAGMVATLEGGAALWPLLERARPS